MSTTPLPPLFAGWVEGALGVTLAPEGRATCHDCAMCSRPGHGPIAPERQFLPDLKCCTYLPQLPNFAVGAILADLTPEMAEGRARILDRLRQGLALTPLGMGSGPDYRRRYLEASEKDQFGRRHDLLCPYFEGGGCTIWRHREMVCSTFFCRFEGGTFGQDVWIAIKRFLKLAERAVALHCLHALELDAAALAELFEDDGTPRNLDKNELQGYVAPDGRVEPSLARRLWGRWHGREEAFFLACGELARRLDTDGLRRLGGIELTMAEAQVTTALLARTAAPPARLYLGTVEGTALENGQVSVRSSMLQNDPLRLDPETWAALEAAGDGPVAELPAATARRLLEHRVLVPIDGRDLEPEGGEPAPISESDWLRFHRGFQMAPVSLVPEGGRLVILCGAKEIGFDEPDLLAFARRLVDEQNGFRAGAATSWVEPGAAPLAWARVSELLEALRAERVLSRIRPPLRSTHDGPSAGEAALASVVFERRSS